MIWNMYPYTDFHNMNQDWIIRILKAMEKKLDDFVATNSIKYANPFQWNITSQYEKNTLTIDAQSGIAYLSIQAVPSGVAITNTSYWTPVFDLSQLFVDFNKNLTEHDEGQNVTSSASYNAGDWLIWKNKLYYAKTAINIGDGFSVGTNIDRITVETVTIQLSSLINTLNGDVSILQSDVAAIKDVLSRESLNGRSFILIADSYGESPSVSVNWLESAKAALQPFVNEVYTCYVSGGGFGSPVKFLTALQGIESAVTNPAAITDIIVLGGTNDILYMSDVNTGYTAFKAYVTAHYVNANIAIGICGLNTNASDENSIINAVAPTWKAAANSNGDKYIVNSEYVFHDYSALGADGIHPTAAGAPLIAQIVTSYVFNGSVSLADHLKLPTMSGASGVTLTDPSVTMMRNLENVNIDIAVGVINLSTPQAVSNVLIGTIDDAFARGILGIKITSPCLAIKTDDSFAYLTASLKIASGNVYLTLSDPFTVFKSVWNITGGTSVPINLA